VKHGMRCLVAVWLIATSTSMAEDYWERPIPPQGPAPDTHHPAAQDLAPQSCALCHPKQYEQWQMSFHARAVSKGLVGQLPAFDEETQTECLNCHAPRSEQQSRWKTSGLKALGQVKGVDCAACHVRRHRRHGPNAKMHTPHGSVRGLDLFRRADFCAPCHQFEEDGERVNGKLLENTHQEWAVSSYAKAGKPCQHCHMPDKQHNFAGIHTPEMVRKGLAVEARRSPSGVILEASNVGAGHALPTYATPRINIRIQAKEDATRRLDYSIQRTLIWDEQQGWTELSDTRLLPNQTVELRLGLDPRQQAKVIVMVEPDAYYHEHVYPTLLEMIGDELQPSARSILEQAMHESGQTGYLLYEVNCAQWTGQVAPCSRVGLANPR